MRADSLRTHPCAYDIEIMWGEGEVLCREHVYPPVPFALVTDEGARAVGRTFSVDEAWIDGEMRELVALQDGETWLEHGNLRTRLVPGAELALSAGPLSIRVRGALPESSFARGAPLDMRSHGITLGSFAVHLLALACMALLPPRASSLSLDLATEDLGRMRYLMTPAERSEALPWSDESATTGPQRASESAPSESKVSTSRSSRPGGLAVRGKERERAAAATRQNAGDQGILFALAALHGTLGPDSPFAAGVPSGYDLQNWVGLDGPGGGTFGHLDMRNAGRPGGSGADGTIGAGPLDTGTAAKFSLTRARPLGQRTARVPRARMVGDAEVKGALAKEVIRRTIQRHLNEVRYCYERSLRDQPELAGRVAVSFLINPAGEVQASALDESTMGSRAAEECIVQAVRRWAFPAPEGGGYVRVSYPFLLETSAR